jgi:hypothetical protein
MSLQWWAAYCQTYGQFRATDKQLDELRQKTDTTPMQLRRLAAVRNDFARLLAKLLKESGVGPYLKPGAEPERPKKAGEVDKSKFFRDRSNPGM